MIVKGEKYLVTGGTGVVGQELCKRILELGGKVIVLSRTEEKLKRLQEKYKEIEIVVSDILDKTLVRKSIKDVRGVFHLTALAQGMQSGKPIESINVNLLGSMNILVESLNVDFVLGVSSDKAVQISGNYGATKFLMENLFGEFETINPQTKYRIVRLGNVIYSTDSVLEKWNMKSTSMSNLLQAMSNKYLQEGNQLLVNEIGLQPNENLHEKIKEDGLYTNEMEQYTIKELEEMI